MPVDVLTDVFDALRVGGLIYARTALVRPWAMSFDLSSSVGFHFVERGSIWMRTPNAEPRQVNEGDTLVVLSGWQHTLSDEIDTPERPWEQALVDNARRASPAHDGVVCGAYRLARPAATTMLSGLPPLIHLRRADAPQELATLQRWIARETTNEEPGSAAVSARLVDVLLLQVLRAWSTSDSRDEDPGQRVGWIFALRDDVTREALSALHGDIAKPWTLEALGKQVGVSRASLARRFDELVGTPPATYLRRWRMTVAAQRLIDTTDPVALIARDVGYQSEFSFSRSFKEQWGTSPTSYRRSARTPARQ